MKPDFDPDHPPTPRPVGPPPGSPAHLEQRQRAHVLYTWSAQQSARPVSITGGQGARFFDHEGHGWLDFESQVFNANLGHGENRITEAIAAQARELACAHPAAVFEAKAALGEAIARVTPGDLDHVFLCLSGAEANENAYKIARLVTGRQKVIARRRSYHGATMGALSLTGDNRRWATEPGLWGVLRAEDPYCYRCPFGLEYPACGTRCATHIEHIIQMEGPESIAAIFLEGMTGTAGAFVPPPDYWKTVRAICDRYGILLVADEVLSGFGRTGRWFAVDHFDVVPDMIVMAKGITGGYAPLAAVAMRRAIAAHFEDSTLWCGLTGYAHPISCAAGVAAIRVYEDDGLIEHAAAMGEHLAERLAGLEAKHPLIGDARNLGLLGALDFAEPGSRAPLVPYAAPTPPGSFLARLDAELRARRLHICRKWTQLFIAPPLVIDRATLDEGLDLIDAALTAAGDAP